MTLAYIPAKHPIYGRLTQREFEAMQDAPHGRAAQYRKLAESREAEARRLARLQEKIDRAEAATEAAMKGGTP